jgi:ribosome-binding factor A
MAGRQDKLGEQIRDVVASCFTGGRMSDPRIDGVTITYVRLTADLQLASIYYRVFDQDKIKDAEAGLASCKGFIKKILGRELEVRRVPDLRFFYDESVEVGSRIEGILGSIL